MGNVRLYGSTSGYTELAPPAVAGDNVLTLPSGTGTLATTADVGGKILQVVMGSTSTVVVSSSSTYADTGLEATITPTSATSKILVLVSQNGIEKRTNNTYLGIRLLRGETGILSLGNVAYNVGTTPNNIGGLPISYLDSPATTSAVTYKTEFNSLLNLENTFVQQASSTSTIILMEVGA